MDGKEDRGQQDGEGEREESAFPGLVRLPQGGEADPQDQDDDQKAGDAESDTPHGSDPGRAVTTISVDIKLVSL